MKSDGMASFTVRLPKAIYDRLAARAERELSSLNREANIAIRAHLDADRRKR